MYCTLLTCLSSVAFHRCLVLPGSYLALPPACCVFQWRQQSTAWRQWRLAHGCWNKQNTSLHVQAKFFQRCKRPVRDVLVHFLHQTGFLKRKQTKSLVCPPFYLPRRTCSSLLVDFSRLETFFLTHCLIDFQLLVFRQAITCWTLENCDRKGGLIVYYLKLFIGGFLRA